MNVPKLVLTGGPCAGKSTGLAFLYTRLESSGMRPIIVPESATITILAGARPGIIPVPQFQQGIVELQIFLEDYFEAFAKSLPPESRPVLLCDRGVPDGKAFCKKKDWKKILQTLNTNDVALRDARYKAVFHMVTAAKGALDFYTLQNNAARSETPAQARAQDKKLQEVWLAHPHHRIIGNEGDFSHKIAQVGKLVLEVLGLPEPIEEERKFRVPLNAAERLKALGIKTASVEIEQTYLFAPRGEERRLRKRSQGPFSAYFYCSKIPISKTKRVECEEIISAQDFSALFLQRDPSRKTIRKTRHCYFYKNQFQELDIYSSPKLPFTTLEIETDGKVFLPPCFKSAKEITGNKEFSNANLALR